MLVIFAKQVTRCGLTVAHGTEPRMSAAAEEPWIDSPVCNLYRDMLPQFQIYVNNMWQKPT